MTTRVRLFLIVCFVALGGTASATTASAAQIGQMCKHVGTTYSSISSVMNSEQFGAVALYYLATGDWFRIEGWGSTGVTYYGHGNGRASGYAARHTFDQSSCHF